MSQQLLKTDSTHSASLSSLVDTTWNYARDALLSAAKLPLSSVAEAWVVALMQKITKGQLKILHSSGIYTFPPAQVHYSTQDGLQRSAELRVIDDTFWLRLVAMSDLGFAEAYMYGEVECDDLVELFKIFLDNRSNLVGLENSFTSYLFSIPQTITSYRFINTISNSRSNISAHYDISNKMFQAFLSEDMTYSCGIFEDLDGDLKEEAFADHSKWNGGMGLTRYPRSAAKIPKKVVAPSAIAINGIAKKTKDELREAQLRKIRHIIQKADIQRGHRVLEIGSGWGSLAILAVQETGCEVDTITLSSQQQALARERIAAAGLSDKIRVHLMDYRNMPESWKGAFDRVVSVEMIEAVGAEFLDTYWNVVDWALHPEHGVGVVQVITIPEARYTRYIREIDFIRKWFFKVNKFTWTNQNVTSNTHHPPGGFLPTVTLLLESINRGSSGRLVVDSISNIGPHYARTLREWRRRFITSFDSHILPSLMEEYPDVMTGSRGPAEIQVFMRKWIYYFCYCEVGFTTRTLGDHIIAFSREGNQRYGCNVFQ